MESLMAFAMIFPNGDTLQIANYINGKRNGEYKLFYPTKIRESSQHIKMILYRD